MVGRRSARSPRAGLRLPVVATVAASRVGGVPQELRLGRFVAQTQGFGESRIDWGLCRLSWAKNRLMATAISLVRPKVAIWLKTWVESSRSRETSCSSFSPALRSLPENHPCQVIFAKELLVAFEGSRAYLLRAPGSERTVHRCETCRLRPPVVRPSWWKSARKTNPAIEYISLVGAPKMGWKCWDSSAAGSNSRMA